MNQRIVITESEKNRILNMHETFKNGRIINEQSEERKFMRAIQRFLNDKKIYGSNKKPLVVDGRTDNNLTSQTAQAISNYQSSIKVYPADGVWGPQTWEKMPSGDQKKLKNLMADEGGIFDRFLNWLGLY